MESSIKMMDLNDDCLYHIFKMLNAKELAYTAQSCRRFFTIIQTFNQKYEINIQNIMQQRQLTTKESHKFFHAIGHHILSLNVPVKICENPIKLFNIIQKYCRNIKHLRIERWLTLDFDKYHTLLNRLETLELEECLLSKDVYWAPFLLMNGKRTKMTSSSKCKSNGSKFMESFSNLQSLTLHNCINIPGDQLIDMLSSSKSSSLLKHMKLAEQSTMFCDNSRWFDSIVRNLKQIECISLDSESTKNLNLNFLTELPLLKKLQLINYNKLNALIIDQLLPMLAINDLLEELDLHSCHLTARSFNALKLFTKLRALKMNKNYWIFNDNLIELCLKSQLKEFRLFDCLHISDEGVIRFVEMNNQLKLLDLSWCNMITNYAINSIVNILKCETYRPNLEIIATGRTRINTYQLNDEILKNQTKVKLTTTPVGQSMNISINLQNQTCGCAPKFYN